LTSDPDGIYVVANKEHRFRVIDDLDCMKIRIPEDNLLFEPIGRNTLPAVYWGMKVIRERGSRSKVLVLPSDHYWRQSDRGRS